ncbi:PepSY-associated TM helix domain-containing protein [Pseudomonas sp. NPDC089534]|uniref:PepSY-associated TM helix domain-containing protein n=1 Tax=Pseudomonas sp. NPDC089534 TaxID=3364468 RepID=UPI0038064899
MKEGFRQSMAWLHTWSGLLFGWLLFAIFLTGTLAYFKDETSRWMQPEIPVRALDTPASLALAQDYLQHHAADASRWVIDLPDARDPGLNVRWQQAPAAPGERGRFNRATLDAQTGAAVQPRESAGGEFFYRFHFQLQMPYPWGRWLATAAAMVMFIALISGIVTHKKIFKDFFTFRPRKGQRSWLDGHNAVGVLVLPFHLMITYSSLVIFMSMVMPASILVTYGSNLSAFYEEVMPETPLPARSGQPAALPALAPLLQRAAEHWPGGHVARVTVSHPGDANAAAVLSRATADQVVYDYGNDLTFNAVTGQRLGKTPDTPLPMAVAGGFYGLHMGQFATPLLRWLYFVCGLAGTAMIGTGLVIWLGKRQLQHAKRGAVPFELRLVRVLNIASMAGLVTAVAVFFWANRALPLDLSARAGWEVNAFFIAWGLSVVHAALRSGRKAWVEQLSLAAVLFATLPLLDWATAGRYLGAALEQGDWTLAGFDLTCLAAGLFLGWAARKMQRTGLAASAVRPRREAARPPALEQGTN